MCSLLQTCFSVLLPSVPPCNCNIAKIDISHKCQSTNFVKAIGFKILLNSDEKFFPIRPGVSLLARKNRLVMNWFSFLGQEYSFINPIVSCLITTETLKSQIIFGALNLRPNNSSALDPSRNYDCFAIAFSFIKLNLLPQKGHYLKCLDKSLLVLGGLKYRIKAESTIKMSAKAVFSRNLTNS